MICAFPGCNLPGEKHHVTYHPPVIRSLCRKHHSEITAINATQSRKYHCKLSNGHRWMLFNEWIAGKRKARRTKKTREWEDQFD
jgi:hypothetical protein